MHKTLSSILACCVLAHGAAFAAEDPCAVDLKPEVLDSDPKAKASPHEQVVTKVQGASSQAFSIPRKAELEQLTKRLVRELLDRNLSKEDTLAKLKAGIAAGCTALNSSQDPNKSVDAAYKAAGLPEPSTHSAGFPDTSDGTSTYSLMLGPVYSLEADGGWKSAVEASFVSFTQFFGKELESAEVRSGKAATDWTKLAEETRAFGRFEATYSSIGKIDDGESDSAVTQNPFAAGGGIFRVNMGVDAVTGHGWWGATTGVGLSTQPSEAETEDVDARRRWYAGMLFLADYGSSEKNAERVTGRVAIGYSDDQFWKYPETLQVDGVETTRERDESKRWFIDARVDGPGVFDSESVKLSVRMFIDHPTSGRGPTDVRISLLVTADLGILFGN